MIVPHYVSLLITGARADTRIEICRQRAARCNSATGGNCGCKGCGGAAAATARYSLWPSLIMQVWYHRCPRRSITTCWWTRTIEGVRMLTRARCSLVIITRAHYVSFTVDENDRRRKNVDSGKVLMIHHYTSSLCKFGIIEI